MRIDPKKVQFIAPTSPGLFVKLLRFVGPENTVQLQETALVIEGNLLKVGLFGLERLFRRALAEWSTITIPYSRIVKFRYIRFPLLRLIALIYLIILPIITILIALGPGGILGALTGLLIGSIPGVLAVYVLIRVPPRHVITFRTRDGRTTQLMLYLRGKSLSREFTRTLKEYRDASKQYAGGANQRVRRFPNRIFTVLGILLLPWLILLTGFLVHTYLAPLAQSWKPAPNNQFTNGQTTPFNSSIRPNTNTGRTIPRIMPMNNEPAKVREVAPQPRSIDR